MISWRRFNVRLHQIRKIFLQKKLWSPLMDAEQVIAGFWFIRVYERLESANIPPSIQPRFASLKSAKLRSITTSYLSYTLCTRPAVIWQRPQRIAATKNQSIDLRTWVRTMELSAKRWCLIPRGETHEQAGHQAIWHAKIYQRMFWRGKGGQKGRSYPQRHLGCPLSPDFRYIPCCGREPRG